MAFYPSSKPKGNHANPTHTYFHFQIEVLFGQQKTAEFHTDPHNT